MLGVAGGAARYCEGAKLRKEGRAEELVREKLPLGRRAVRWVCQGREEKQVHFWK